MTALKAEIVPGNFRDNLQKLLEVQSVWEIAKKYVSYEYRWAPTYTLWSQLGDNEVKKLKNVRRVLPICHRVLGKRSYCGRTRNYRKCKKKNCVSTDSDHLSPRNIEYSWGRSPV